MSFHTCYTVDSIRIYYILRNNYLLNVFASNIKNKSDLICFTHITFVFIFYDYDKT